MASLGAIGVEGARDKILPVMTYSGAMKGREYLRSKWGVAGVVVTWSTPTITAYPKANCIATGNFQPTLTPLTGDNTFRWGVGGVVVSWVDNPPAIRLLQAESHILPIMRYMTALTGVGLTDVQLSYWRISGTVRNENGAVASRKLLAVERDTGKYVGQTMSGADGLFTLYVPRGVEHDVIAQDNVEGTVFNDLIARIVPEAL